MHPDVMGRVRDYQEAGHRVIDDELATHASSRGWEIIGGGRNERPEWHPFLARKDKTMS